MAVNGIGIGLGYITGPICLILAVVSLYLLCKNRIKVKKENRIIIDFASISIICAVFWGLSGTFTHFGFLTEEMRTTIAEVLSTLYLVFTFLATWYFINTIKSKKKK
jgi:uncharacterized membrane protein YuzA (DUF378 family)